MEDCIGEVNLAEFSTAILSGMAKVLKDDTYYVPRIRQSKAFAITELQIARYVCKTFGPKTRLLEIGCGFGQLCLLLRAAGFEHVTGIEAHRQVSSLGMLEHIRSYDRWDVDGLDFLSGTYPTETTVEADVLIAFNVVNSCWYTWKLPEEEKYKVALPQPHCIIDVRLWWEVREDPKEQQAVVSRIQKEVGLSSAILMYPDATLWHFSR